jgi:5-formyltetrahydrofolate cyclo-ligase
MKSFFYDNGYIFTEQVYLNMDIPEQKKALRKQMFDARKTILPGHKVLFDQWINESIGQLIADRGFRTVHVYIPMLNEIDIHPLISNLLEQQIKVIVPKTLPKRKLENRVLHSLTNLETGIMGTQHPAEPDVYDGPVDLIVVPGMAFDAKGYRLGYGGGYYDNFIVGQPSAFKVGIFYPFQQVEQVPVEAHDICLDHILTKDFDLL